MSELKSCPFCGSGDIGGTSGGKVIYCYGCRLTVTSNTGIAGWNTRAPQQPPSKLTDDEILDISASLSKLGAGDHDCIEFARAIEKRCAPQPATIKNECCTRWRDDALEQAAIIAEQYGSSVYVAQDIHALKSSPIAQPAAVPSGWKLAPIDPTEDMLRAARICPVPCVLLDSRTAQIDLENSCKYKEMLNAAPSPAVVSGEAVACVDKSATGCIRWNDGITRSDITDGAKLFIATTQPDKGKAIEVKE